MFAQLQCGLPSCAALPLELITPRHWELGSGVRLRSERGWSWGWCRELKCPVMIVAATLIWAEISGRGLPAECASCVAPGCGHCLLRPATGRKLSQWMAPLFPTLRSQMVRIIYSQQLWSILQIIAIMKGLSLSLKVFHKYSRKKYLNLSLPKIHISWFVYQVSIVYKNTCRFYDQNFCPDSFWLWRSLVMWAGGRQTLT